MTPGLRVVSLTFAVTGAVTVLLGPLLPHLSARMELSDARSGRLFLAQFLASTAGALLLGRFGGHWRMERTLALSYLAMGVGVIGLGTAGPLTAPLWVACYGLALGFSNPAANRIAGSGSGANPVAALSLLNMSWSLGAVLAPPAVSSLLGLAGMPLVLLGVGAVALLAGLACLTLRTRTAAQSDSPPAAPMPASARAAAWSAAAFLFLYVGAETVLSGWLPTHAYRSAGVRSVEIGWPQAAFWGAIVAGRFFVGLRPGWATPEKWISRSLGLAAAGIVVLVLSPRLELLLAGAMLAGAGMAPLFPAAVAVFQRAAPAPASAHIGYIFAAGGLGGAVFPWLVGIISSSTGSVAAALLTALLATAGLKLVSRGWAARDRIVAPSRL